MKKHNEKRGKKIRNLVAFCSLCAILLSVSTYAWFIGMTKVSVNSFDINVATTEGLFLSMDGVNWSYNLDAQNTAAYANNENIWANTDDNMGLIPMSTVGDMDSTASRMKIFQKASLTAVKGGYRLLANRVDNYSTTQKNATSGEYKEGNGYIAFDLFVKNLSGDAYYTDNQVSNEEAIYLTTDSKVEVDEAGGGKKDSGIENSVRVAFVQIGRVNAETNTAATITGITCKDVMDGETKVVTGICRNAQIWEPNDTLHVKNAINWYEKSCLERDNTGTEGNKVNEDGSYKATACGAVSNGNFYPTYAISRNIDVGDHVNVYDGTAYNKYTKNEVAYATYAAEDDDDVKATYKLVDFPYFKDTDKIKPGNTRPQFMTLAPNSITKLRVYVYIEGQDIDNYDFAQLGKHIAINFGFTKERYEESDFPEYNGPDTDITPTGTATVAQ